MTSVADCLHQGNGLKCKHMYDKEKPKKKPSKDARKESEELEIRRKKVESKKKQKYPLKWDRLLDEDEEIA